MITMLCLPTFRVLLLSVFAFFSTCLVSNATVIFGTIEGQLNSGLGNFFIEFRFDANNPSSSNSFYYNSTSNLPPPPSVGVWWAYDKGQDSVSQNIVFDTPFYSLNNGDLIINQAASAREGSNLSRTVDRWDLFLNIENPVRVKVDHDTTAIINTDASLATNFGINGWSERAVFNSEHELTGYVTHRYGFSGVATKMTYTEQIDKPTIVLTHGFCPSAQCNVNDSSYMTELVQDMTTELERRKINSDDVNIIVFKWDAAFQNSILDYNSSAVRVEEAGYKLAKELYNFLGKDYKGEIHFIGHSLGAAVNANAVHVLERIRDSDDVFNVSQFTILDHPERVPGGFYVDNSNYRGFDDEYFYRLLKEGHVSYVDNYYGTGLSITEGEAPGYGETIRGAGPVQFLGGARDLCPSLGFDGYTQCGHTGVWNEMYRNIIRGEAPGSTIAVPWLTSADPAFDNPLPWSPPKDRPVYSISDEIPADNFDHVTGNVSVKTVVIDGVLVSVLELRESSPAVASYQFSELYASRMVFDFQFAEAGDGDWFEILLDDVSVWSFMPFDDMSHFIEIELIFNMSKWTNGLLTLILHSEGEANSSVRLSNFRFLADKSHIVSEPRFIFIFSAAFCIIIICLKKRLNYN